MMYYERASHNYSILHYAIENTVANTIHGDIRAVYNGDVGCDTVEYSTIFWYCDWLCFLWRGIKLDTNTFRAVYP